MRIGGASRHPRRTGTRRRTPSLVGRVVLALLMLAVLAGTGHTASEVHRRTGRLVVRSTFSPMIAVDLRDGDPGGFLVGRIGPNSTLRRGGRPVGLQDFTEGETVKVTWQKTGEDTEILTLLAWDPAPSDEHLTVLPHSGDIGAIIGQSRQHTVGQEETFLDIARRYDLGFNEVMALHPQYDPWLPPVGKDLEIPTTWLLPDAPHEDLAINIPEMRLFFYMREAGGETVRTFPLGIGDTDFPTPTGAFRIGVKCVHPTWYVPQSLRGKYQRASFPPGPDNPLGDYWVGLGNSTYGIHGTDIPWAVGRLVTRGCIRMYPEDIAGFFPMVESGMKIDLVYQPVKVALISGRLLIEVHRDIYSHFDNLAVHGRRIIGRLGLSHLLDELKFMRTIARQDGVPRDVTLERSRP